MYLFRWRKGGGALMHVYEWEHIVSLYYRTTWWMFTKLSRDEVLMAPHMHLGVSARSTQERIQGGAKIGHGGPLLQETSSYDWKATVTNGMDSNDLEACGKKCCYFWFHSEVKFLTRFWHLFGLSHFGIFKCNFYTFLCKVSKWDKAYIKDLNAWRFLMIFLCIYLGEGNGGGGALMHVYVLEHIISLSYRTTWWMFTKLDRDEVLIIMHLFIGFSANSTQGRIQWGGGGQFAKNRSMRGFLLQRTSSDRNATAANRMHPRILNWNIAIVAVLTDFTNMAVMLSDLLRNLTFNRNASCTQVSDQCPLGLLLVVTLKDLHTW